MSLGVNICYLLIFQNVFCAIENVANLKIAGIFENFQLHQTAFTYSNNIYNFDKTAKDAAVSHIVDPYILKDEPFTALKGTCSFLRQSIVGLFGPQSSHNLDIVQSITERKDIPHILTRWINPLQMGFQTINFFPNPDRLADGFLDIINALEWQSFTILYTNAENLLKINQFIRKAKDDGIIVYMENVDTLKNGDFRPALRSAGRSGQKNFVLDCPIRDLKVLLTQLQQVGLLTAEYNYFLTNLDAHTEDLTPFQYSDAVITGVHLINAKDEMVLRASQELCHLYNVTFKLECGKPELDIETALIIDSVSVFLQTLNSQEVTQGQYLDCDDEEGWAVGLNIINALKTGSFEGITGKIEFDKNGFRSAFQLTIYQIRDDFYIRGTWNTTDGLSEDIELTFSEDEDEDSELKDRELVVLITLTEPYARLKEAAFHLKGNDRFEGFAVDLIEAIALLEGFDYTFTVRDDNKHGYFDSKSGKWNGMIADIIEGKADMAIADLTINTERLGPVEFTHPFMTLGISILFRKAAEVPPSFFHFAQPFSITFWQYLGGSYLIMVFSLFLIGRLSCSEWQSPHTCKETKKYLVNELTFLNSFWFVAAGLFRQPTNVKINSIAAKIIAAAWYIYCFVLFAMYISYSFTRTAIVEKEQLFENAEELIEYAETSGIKYGAMKGGATEVFFKNSKVPTYKQIAAHMEEHPEEMAESTPQGIERVMGGNYAFFMESATIDYTVRRQCNLTNYGELLDSKGFGIAVRKGSFFLRSLNKAILKLQASGELLRLKKVWWEEKYAGDSCDDEETVIIDQRSVLHITGLLYITFLGTAVALVLSIFEFTVYVIRLSKKVKQSFGTTFGEEIKKCFGKNHTVQNVEEIALTKPENGNSSNKENA